MTKRNWGKKEHKSQGKSTGCIGLECKTE